MNATTTKQEKQFKVVCGGEERIGPQSQAMEVADEMFAKHKTRPSIEPLTPEPVAEPAVELAPVVPIRAPSTAVASAPVKAGDVDESAKKRIDEQQRILREGGVTGLGYRGEGGDGDQFYRNGTRMLDIGYDTQCQRKAEHEAAIPIEAAAMGLSAKVKAEGREDYICTARDVANNLQVHGQLKVFGRTLTEQAIRGLTSRCESPALGYLLGLQTRVDAERAKPEEERNDSRILADLGKAADVLRHECLLVNPRQRLEQRRGFLRHEQVQFGVGKIFAQGAQRGREQDGVAEVFELQRENFFRPGVHEANWSS